MKTFGIRTYICDRITNIIPKKKNLILFTAWFGKKYADSSMYLFEYLLRQHEYEIYWYADDRTLYQKLQNDGIPVVYSKSIRGYWYQVRAKMLVSSVQFDDYNPYLINKCIFLDLGHGFPGKPGGIYTPGITQKSIDRINKNQRITEFYQVAPSSYCADCSHKYFNTPYSHIIFANKPRIDVLFDEELQSKQLNRILEIKSGKKAIVYLPTHRSNGRKTMQIHKILDLDSIQRICEQNNAIFIIKKHFYHKHEVEDLDHYRNIIDISQTDIDTQILLSQTDVLITDFSSCYIDYLALDRPVMFYAYDYDEYMCNERDYSWKYDNITAGYTTKTPIELNNALIELSIDWLDSAHSIGRKEMKSIYFDSNIEMGGTRKKLKNVIDELIKGTYVPYNWHKK